MEKVQHPPYSTLSQYSILSLMASRRRKHHRLLIYEGGRKGASKLASQKKEKIWGRRGVADSCGGWERQAQAHHHHHLRRWLMWDWAGMRRGVLVVVGKEEEEEGELARGRYRCWLEERERERPWRESSYQRRWWSILPLRRCCRCLRMSLGTSTMVPSGFHVMSTPFEPLSTWFPSRPPDLLLGAPFCLSKDALLFNSCFETLFMRKLSFLAYTHAYLRYGFLLLLELIKSVFVSLHPSLVIYFLSNKKIIASKYIYILFDCIFYKPNTKNIWQNSCRLLVSKSQPFLTAWPAFLLCEDFLFLIKMVCLGTALENYFWKANF